jgi:nicotinamide riboside transporter PnuC
MPICYIIIFLNTVLLLIISYAYNFYAENSALFFTSSNPQAAALAFTLSVMTTNNR